MWKSVCNGHCVTNLFQLKEFIFYGFYSLDDLRFADKPHKSEPRKESLHTASESSESVCIKRFASYPAQITLINTYINVYVCVYLYIYIYNCALYVLLMHVFLYIHVRYILILSVHLKSSIDRRDSKMTLSSVRELMIHISRPTCMVIFIDLKLLNLCRP